MRGLRLLLPLLLLGILFLLYWHDPSGSGMHPSCPFHRLTGLECPGCGSQRAVHHLLHGRLAEALAHNALLVVAIPLAIVHVLVARGQAGRGRPVAKWLIAGWALLIVGWGIVRNLWPGS